MSQQCYEINDKKCTFELQNEIGVGGKKNDGWGTEACNLIFLSVSK